MQLDFRNFDTLLSQFPQELQDRVMNLKNVQQRADAHPEGDVLTHTKIVFNRLAKYNNIHLSLAALFHDIGKDETTKLSDKGILQAIGHELVSAKLCDKYEQEIRVLLYKVVGTAWGFSRVRWLVEQHMRIKGFDLMRPKKQKELFEHHGFGELHIFTQCDSMKNVTKQEILKAK